MSPFETKRLPAKRTKVAPDGSDVRVLLELAGGGVAHFELGAGEVSLAVAHHHVEEIWFFLSGRGELWRRQGERVQTVLVEGGLCLTIPVGTHFQFRCVGTEPLAAIAVTMPPWPGDGEAYYVDGAWPTTVEPPSA